MPLLIRALRLDEEPLGRTIQAVFDQSGGTIGRSDSNTLVLPDRQRSIARVHARIDFESGEYWIEDVGGGLASVLNGRALGWGDRLRLRAQDELRISAYRLIVDDVEDTALGMADDRALPHANLFADLGALCGARGPLDDALDMAPDIAEKALADLFASLSANRLPGELSGAPEFPDPGPALDPTRRHFPGALTPPHLGPLAALAKSANSGHAPDATSQVDSALSRLLQFPADDPATPEAVGEAQREMGARQSGAVAAMHAALEHLLDQFEPARLEGSLGRGGAAESRLLSSRTLRLWETYVQNFPSIRADAREGFLRLFDKMLVAACEAQADRLRRARSVEER